MAEGVPLLRVIPTANLHPAKADANKTGLTAAYYTAPNFEGEPAFTRVDPVVNFVWKGVSPLNGQWGGAFAVRWTGFLVPPVSGIYRLGVNGYTRYSLYLDDELVVEHQNFHHPIIRTKEVDLEAGRLYRLRLDYVNRDLDPQVRLLWSVPGVDLTSGAIEAAKKAEVVVMVMGLSPGLEGEEMPVQVPGFASGDRTEIKLPSPQQELLKRIHALGKPIVLVLLSGSAIAIPWAADNIPAVVEAWYPGQAGGDAIADVLFGDYNPAGRLPVTVYKSVDDLPAFDDYRMEGRTYRYFRGEPLFPFGHGLSYTTFAYSHLQLSAEAIAPGERLSLSVEVRNVGERAGDEVVQLYVSDVAASVPVPIRQLAGLTRIHLAPGETQTVAFTLTPRQLSLIDDDGRRVIEPGQFRVAVGGRQPTDGDLAGQSTDVVIGTFEVRGEVIEVA